MSRPLRYNVPIAIILNINHLIRCRDVAINIAAWYHAINNISPIHRLMAYGKTGVEYINDNGYIEGTNIRALSIVACGSYVVALGIDGSIYYSKEIAGSKREYHKVRNIDSVKIHDVKFVDCTNLSITLIQGKSEVVDIREDHCYTRNREIRALSYKIDKDNVRKIHRSEGSSIILTEESRLYWTYRCPVYLRGRKTRYWEERNNFVLLDSSYVADVCFTLDDMVILTTNRSIVIWNMGTRRVHSYDHVPELRNIVKIKIIWSAKFIALTSEGRVYLIDFKNGLVNSKYITNASDIELYNDKIYALTKDGPIIII